MDLNDIKLEVDYIKIDRYGSFDYNDSYNYRKQAKYVTPKDSLTVFMDISQGNFCFAGNLSSRHKMASKKFGISSFTFFPLNLRNLIIFLGKLHFNNEA